MHHTLPDGSQLYYEVHGPEQPRRTLVFLNGLSQSTLNWQPFVASLADRYRIVLVDLIFQGQSDRTGEFRTYDQHAADVAHLIAALDVAPIVVVGISYGGGVAQHLLVEHGALTEGAVLLSTFAHQPPYFLALGDAWQAALSAGGYSLMLDVMLPSVLGKSYFESPLISVDQLKALRVGRELTTEQLEKLMRGTAERPDYREQLRRVSVPTLVVQGEEDILCTPAMGRAIAEAIPNARFEQVDRAGHTLNFEAIPQTLALIEGFLND